MPHTFSDQEQFELFQQGDVDACSYFFRRHHQGVYHYIRSMTADDQTAQELSQDVFKRLWDLRRNVHSPTHLGAYIYVMARQLYLEHLRTFNVTNELTRELAFSAEMREAMNHDLQAVCHRVLADMKAAMQRLSTKRRLVLQLLYLKGLDINAIAQMLQLSPQTVRNHKAQATAFLRERLFDRDLVMHLSLSILLRYSEES